MKKELMEVLEKEGIRRAVQALNKYDYEDYCLFNADVAELVLPFFKKKYPKDKRPRLAIEGIRKWHAGEITDAELEDLSDAADTAAHAANSDAAAYAVYTSFFAANYHTTAYKAVASAAASAYASYSSGTDRKKQWEKIKEIFVKHFGGDK